MKVKLSPNVARLWPYQRQIIEASMPHQDASDLLEIACDPKNADAHFLGGPTAEGWLVTRRPGALSNTFLVWGRISFSESAPHRFELSMGLQPVLLFVLLAIGLAISLILTFLAVEPWLAGFVVGALLFMLTLVAFLEHILLKRLICRLLTLD